VDDPSALSIVAEGVPEEVRPIYDPSAPPSVDVEKEFDAFMGEGGGFVDLAVIDARPVFFHTILDDQGWLWGEVCIKFTVIYR
jgi:hypothetical protein